MLTTKQCQTKLNQYFKKNFKHFDQDEVEFYVDKEDKEKYIWEFKYEKKSYRLVLDKKTGKINQL